VATAATHLLVLNEEGQLSSSYPGFLCCTALSFAGLKLQSEATDVLPRGSCMQQVCGWALHLLLLLLWYCCSRWSWQCRLKHSTLGLCLLLLLLLLHVSELLRMLILQLLVGLPLTLCRC
jgi:hypothetical protein